MPPLQALFWVSATENVFKNTFLKCEGHRNVFKNPDLQETHSQEEHKPTTQMTPILQKYQ